MYAAVYDDKGCKFDRVVLDHLLCVIVRISSDSRVEVLEKLQTVCDHAYFFNARGYCYALYRLCHLVIRSEGAL